MNPALLILIAVIIICAIVWMVNEYRDRNIMPDDWDHETLDDKFKADHAEKWDREHLQKCNQVARMAFTKRGEE